MGDIITFVEIKVEGALATIEIAKPQGEKMDKLELLKLAEQQDVEAYDNEDFEQPPKKFSEQYRDFYDDVKQPNNYIKEDW